MGSLLRLASVSFEMTLQAHFSPEGLPRLPAHTERGALSGLPQSWCEGWVLCLAYGCSLMIEKVEIHDALTVLLMVFYFRIIEGGQDLDPTFS